MRSATKENSQDGAGYARAALTQEQTALRRQLQAVSLSPSLFSFHHFQHRVFSPAPRVKLQCKSPLLFKLSQTLPSLVIFFSFQRTT